MSLEIQKSIQIDKNGSEFVYLFFYPTYKEMALINDVVQWPCKIGRTDINPITRVLQQLNSSAPELPELALVFQCNDSRELESTIHHYMKLHHRFIIHDFNNEWFNTNPDEVEYIVNSLLLSPESIWSNS